MCKKNKKETTNRTLLILVGKITDIEEQSKITSNLISMIEPNNIIFLVSKESKKLTNNIISKYDEITNKKLPKRNIITINSDYLGDVYSKIVNQIHDNDKREIFIDQTYASGVMDTAATLCKDKNPSIELIQIKDFNGEYNLFTENLDFLQLKDSYKTATKFFNTYQYVLVKEELFKYDADAFDIETNKETGAYVILSDIYENFDKGEFNVAYKHFLESKKSGALQYIFNKFTKSKQQISKNRKALAILSDTTHKDYKKYYLASLICDAQRRLEEEKFNDAILRLYRALTVVSEIELSDIQLDPYNINLHYLRSLVSKEVFEKDIKDKIYYTNGSYHTCGLTCNFQILNKVRKYNEVGKFFLKNLKKYYRIVGYRNNNKLAHGYNNANLFECLEMLDFVLDFAKLAVSDLEEIVNDVKFPTI